MDSFIESSQLLEMGITTIPLKRGIGRLCGPNLTVVGGSYGASLGHPTQNPHPEPCCVLLARVLMTVVLRPGCASNPEACSRIRTHQFQRETVEPENCTVKHPGGSDGQPSLVAMVTLQPPAPMTKLSSDNPHCRQALHDSFWRRQSSREHMQS